MVFRLLRDESLAQKLEMKSCLSPGSLPTSETVYVQAVRLSGGPTHLKDHLEVPTVFYLQLSLGFRSLGARKMFSWMSTVLLVRPTLLFPAGGTYCGDLRTS